MYEVRPYNFGALQPLPAGYAVNWYAGHEHYQAVGPDEWESPITCNPLQARAWAFARAAAIEKSAKAE